jgi:hypothetical protein
MSLIGKNSCRLPERVVDVDHCTEHVQAQQNRLLFFC